MANDFSFLIAYNSLPANKQTNFTKELQSALNMSYAGVRKRMRGMVEPRMSEMRKIEALFKKYGIKEVWDNDNEFLYNQ